jgi:hypothetical protein
MTVFETTQWGEQRISPAFYAALATALGATDLETDQHSNGRMTVGPVRLCFRQGYGANARRMTASAYSADRDAHTRAHRYGRPVSFPEATFDPARPLDALAKDIGKRLIDKSAPALASIAAMDAAQLAFTADLETKTAALQKAIPALQITLSDHEATLRAAGFSARMGRDGGLYFQSLSVSPAKARAVLAILTAKDA